MNPDEQPRPTDRPARDEARGPSEAAPTPATGHSEKVPEGDEARYVRDLLQELHRLQQENNVLLRAILDRLPSHD